MLKAKNISKCLAGSFPKMTAEHGFWGFYHIQIFSYVTGFIVYNFNFSLKLKALAGIYGPLLC